MTVALPEFWSKNSIVDAQRTAKALKSFRPPNKASRALVCPPTTPGSLGDEAMLQGLIHKLIDRGFKVDLLVIDLAEDWSHLEGITNFVALPRFVEYQSYITQFNQYSHFYLIGADCMDGYYEAKTPQWLLWLCYAASLVCNKVTIVGFSFNKSPSSELRESFNALGQRNVRINNRDPFSYRRFRQFSTAPNHLTADAAFLLRPTKKAAYKFKRRTIGLNVSPHSLLGSASFEEIVRHFSTELTAILKANEDVDIILIPHDFRGEESDNAMLTGIAERLKSNRVTLAHYSNHPAREIKRLVQDLDFVITGRMHLAIACLGSGTPAVCVTYQDKFEGLFEHFNLNTEKLLVTPEKILKEGALQDIIKALYEENNTLREQINKKLPYVLGLSEMNLE